MHRAEPTPADHPLLDVLTAHGARADRLTHVRTLPARTGEHSDWPAWADPGLVAGYRALGVERPWRHQVEAADALHQDRHVALATSTGSGKSLGFWLPALTAVRAGRDLPASDAGRIETVGRRSTVLYLSPTKALAADQHGALTRLLDAAGARDVRAATCDGDTPAEERRWIVEHADVVLTNPDFLHFALLPAHRRWGRLLRGLRHVVVDEGHAYRGVFGAHVSLVLRRLARLVEHHGGRPPTIVVASATSADPAASAARLIGVPVDRVTAVTRDSSPSGRRTVALWQPPEIASAGLERSGAGDVDPAADPWALPDPLDPTAHEADQVLTVRGAADHPRRSATAEVADLLADLAAHGARTLAFTRSRRGAESVAQQTRDHLRPVDPALVGRIAAYRGGYLPEERRELEQALRTGELLGLATTNALELGVDISGLDAVLVAGWPGTRMSLWQQAGRAGRAGADGLVAFVAREDPLDTYLVTHPEAVFDAPLEATVFDPANPYVLAPQLCAAAQEVALRGEDLDRFGDRGQVREVLDVLVARGLLRRRPSGWYWTHAQPAASMADLRGSGGQPVRVVEATTGRLLGTVDAGSADGQVHDGAVYVHQGVTFVVDRLDLADHVALVVRRDVDHATWSREVMEIALAEAGDPAHPAPEGSPPARGREWGPVTWGLGPVEVTSQVVSFQRRRVPDMQVLDTEPLELPERTLGTTAVWWSVPDHVLRAAGVDADAAPGALHAAEHAAIGILPLLATCDRWDLGGVSTDLHPDTGEATVFVYDAYPGGAGFAERGYEQGERWLRAVRDAVAACPCPDGCPACVQSPKCGNDNSPLDKAGAVRVLDAVLSHAPVGT
ncbi:DEAD/DEAH box helicase [Isoptericola chiayiensis]|uniref:DEAD/DEAH box helicase n=1 Tax=Isoptericola chiayiensis TaxID=579446 RepID=A0ABP8YCL9_9MICO|nr:DEAD/DEAH box helicase domain-containing protein [Isoptericola chiayiensis]